MKLTHMLAIACIGFASLTGVPAMAQTMNSQPDSVVSAQSIGDEFAASLTTGEAARLIQTYEAAVRLVRETESEYVDAKARGADSAELELLVEQYALAVDAVGNSFARSSQFLAERMMLFGLLAATNPVMQTLPRAEAEKLQERVDDSARAFADKHADSQVILKPMMELVTEAIKARARAGENPTEAMFYEESLNAARTILDTKTSATP